MIFIDQSKRYRILLLFAVLGLAACRQGTAPIELHLPVTSLAGASTATHRPTITFTLPPSPTLIPENTPAKTSPQPSKTPTQTMPVCSPLPGYTQAELVAAISNPYHPPARPGSDDPHQAIDLAVERYGIAITGEMVQAVLPGQVAGLIADRFPYGHAVIIETALDRFSLERLDELQAPTPAPTLGPHPSLTCPQVETQVTWEEDSRSLYLLYAHLLEAVELKMGDMVGCSEMLGKIGQSGNALNPHLHLEARVGPSGARFASMAHYSGGITLEEMANYCTWRVSGVFQVMDPMRVLQELP